MKPLFLIFFVTSLFSAPAESEFIKISESRQWHLLLHYKKNLFGKIKSQADGKKFFFSGIGHEDPLAELKASFLAFKNAKNTKNPNNHIQCKFPTRFKFINESFNLNIKKELCPDYTQWINSLSPESAALIFANNYPSNPASAFGHTFLRINSKRGSHVQAGNKKDKRIDILDYVVGFAADTKGEDGLKFAYKGIAGGYHGIFNLGPYYLKIAEYTKFEDRDLWEYHLNLTPKQTRKMVSHIWELAFSTHFNYYFLDENCSYYVLTLLEVANPDWHLSDKFSFVVPPSDTIKVLLSNENVLKKVRYRPSMLKNLRALQEKLNDYQLGQYNNIIETTIKANEIVDPKILDATISYFAYKKKSKKALSPDDKKVYREILLARAKLPNISSDAQLDLGLINRPEDGHDSSQVSIATGMSRTQSFQELQWRLGLHDQLNLQVGNPHNSVVEFGKFKARYYNGDHKFRIDQVDLIKMTTLIPFNKFNKKISWELEANFISPKDFSRTDVLTFNFAPKAGLSFDLIKNSLTTFALAGMYSQVHSEFSKGYRFGPLSKVGIIYTPVKNIRGILSNSVLWDLGQDERSRIYYKTGLGHSYIYSQNIDIRIVSDLVHGDGLYYEHQASLNYHF